MARERWTNRGAFIMAAIGSAIGLGNVWRFPYMVGMNGGGAFFIPYIIALITTGIPLVALEYYLGIRFQHGPTEAYGFVKKRSNFIGWFSIGVAAMITIYYAVVMAWSLNYVIGSVGVQWAGMEQDFFLKNVLQLSGGHFEFGGQVWALVIANLIVWLSIFLIIFKGVKVVGKVVNWTVGIPWVLLLLLIIRGVTLPGAAEGLNFYLDPDFSMLLNPEIWLAAYGQIFFSLSLGFGLMIAYASYMPKDSDINTSAWVVSFGNCATSFFAGFAIFSTLGYFAAASGTPVSEVASEGGGLAFIIFPTAIAQLPGGVLWQSIFGIVFFLMLFMLGVDSAFSLVEGIVTSVKDSFKVKRETATFWICVAGFLIGLIYTSKAGMYWLDVVDNWMNWGLAIVGLMEAVLIGWFYKASKVAEDIDSTSTIKFGKVWVVCVKYITPVVLVIILIGNFINEFNNPAFGYPIVTLMIGGWILLTALLFLSFLFQERENWKHPSRLVGYPLIFAGLISSVYMFYTPEMRVWAAVLLVASVSIGSFIVYVMRRMDIEPAKEA